MKIHDLVPNKAASKVELADMHPGVCSKVMVEGVLYEFYKSGRQLPAGDKLAVTKPVSGTWVAT